MDQKAFSAKLDAIAGLVVEMYAMLDDAPVMPSTTPSTITTGNPYADTLEMIKVINDVHLEAGPRIMNNVMSSRYWRKIWDIADKANVKFIVLRGAHPGGCVDVRYPQFHGVLDKVAMKAIVNAFMAVCVAVDSMSNETEIRMGGDVWPLVDNRHIQIDDSWHHRFDDPEFPHFHMRVGA